MGRVKGEDIPEVCAGELVVCSRMGQSFCDSDVSGKRKTV